MDNELKKQAVVEPEIIDEHGHTVRSNNCEGHHAEGVKSDLPEQARRTVVTLLGGAVALISGLMMFILFAVIMVVVAIPMLILSLFGKKPNIKIFKYKM